MVLSADIIERRLRVIDQTSESIQTTSMWIMHHKESIAEIVRIWNEIFKSAADSLQIALFYVANDVCQKAKKRNDSSLLLNAFAPHWTSAIAYVKSLSSTRENEAVTKAVERILNIFDERQIYSKSQIDDMRSALIGLNDTDDGSFDFDTDSLAKDIEAYQKGEMVMERARAILARSDFNFKDKIKSRMKDRQEGQKFLEEIDLAQKKLDNFISTLEKHKKRGTHLIDVLDSGKRFFSLQLRDVTVVEDAYQKFSSGIDSVRLELEEMLKTNIFPGASPPRDAPSPTPNEDPFQGGLETAFEQLKRPKENTEVTDMDVENEEEHPAGDSLHLKSSQSASEFASNIAAVLGAAPSHEGLPQSASQSHPSHNTDPRLTAQSHTPSVANPVTVASTSQSFPITTVVHSTPSAAQPPVLSNVNAQKASAGGPTSASGVQVPPPSLQRPMQSTSAVLSIQPPVISSALAVNTGASPLVSPAGTSKTLPPPMQFSPMSMPPNWMMVPPPNFGVPPHFGVPPFPPPTSSGVTPPLPSGPAAIPSTAPLNQPPMPPVAQASFVSPNRFPMPPATVAPVGVPISNVPLPTSSGILSSLPPAPFPGMPPPPFAPPTTSQSGPVPDAGTIFPSTPVNTASEMPLKNSLPLTPLAPDSDSRRNPLAGVKSLEDGRRVKNENFRGYENNRRGRPYDRPMERRYSQGDRGYNHGRNDRGRYGRFEPGNYANGNRERR